MKKNILFSMFLAVFLVACGQGTITEDIDDPSAEEQSPKENSSSSSEDTASNTTATNEQSDSTEVRETSGGTLSELSAHYIDVGQADATLLQFENYNILFDTGDWRGNEVVTYLQSQNITSLDLVIVSHPDADHVGQLEDVIRAFEVGEVWMSGNESSSKTFQSAVDAVLNSSADYYEPRTGETFEIGNMDIEVVYPNKITGKSNEESISALFTYGDITFLFTGDADTHAEQNMIDSGINLDADVLQLGHHGSTTSSDPAFLEAVSPDIAIYSAGTDNSYGHPHAEVVSYIQDAGISLYGTDVHGTIIVQTDGKKYDILTKNDGTISPKTSESNLDIEVTSKSTKNSSSCVNVNTASVDEVQKVKHIGPARAEVLINNRPYSSIDGLQAINGIGPARIKDIIDEGVACVQNES
ncbi:MBL fold metallo-hydrolase [Ornithinibacillus salinisoli]|uniref:MBL fold metallo-hydrolase n=1 Tax=Ornithinibacillus salinisoli TaxID=1848459 RepID=A0ABW4W138_9BACI